MEEKLYEHSWNRKRVLKLLDCGIINDGTKTIAIFTPSNPGARKYDDFEAQYTSASEKENYRNIKDFISYLRKNNIRYIKANGCFFGENETSFIVRNLQKSVVEKICKKYYQDSFIFGEVKDGRLESIDFYQTPGVHEDGSVEDYEYRDSGVKSEIIDTDPKVDAYTQIDKKSWINHFPHYDNDWDNYENKGKWRKVFESILGK